MYRPVSSKRTSGNSARRPTQTACFSCTTATTLTMTATVKAMDSQRCIWRTEIFQFNETSFDFETSRSATRQTSVRPRQELLKLRKELLPSGVGAAKGQLLIWPEARLLHAQVGPRARSRERKGHYAP